MEKLILFLSLLVIGKCQGEDLECFVPGECTESVYVDILPAKDEVSIFP